MIATKFRALVTSLTALWSNRLGAPLPAPIHGYALVRVPAQTGAAGDFVNTGREV